MRYKMVTRFEKGPNWRHPELDYDNATSWIRGALKVLRSESMMSDGSTWLHVSVSRTDRCPTWDEMALVKDEFIGTDVYAIQVLPPRERHVNLHSFCLHWWMPVTEFTRLPDLHEIIDEKAV